MWNNVSKLAKRPSQWEVQTLFLALSEHYVEGFAREKKKKITLCVLRFPGKHQLLQLFN